MPRQIRVEYEGALYHVMARGDRREAIFRDEEDREMFLRTVEEMVGKTGFVIHAYVLMSNHYHLLVETPRANLVRGMAWLQNAFTRRVNVRHGLWGHLFGGRYKAIVVEPGECFWALLDYIHLNPVRAGLVKEEEGIESYPWSSLPDYLKTPGRRKAWLKTEDGFAVCGCADTAAGRREFLEVLEKRVDWSDPREAGTTFGADEGEPKLAVYSALRRGWLFGSQEFRERLLKLVGKRAGKRRQADGYHGLQRHDYGEKRARALIEAGRSHFQMTKKGWPEIRKGDWRKGLIAAMIQDETTMKLDWISEQLDMGTRAGVCRAAAIARLEVKSHRVRRRDWDAILKNINFK